MANGLDEDDLMFGGMERVVETPRNAGADDEAEIRIACKKELQLCLGTPGIPLRTSDGEFSDPLLWWKGMSERDRLPILCQLARQFLAIPATSAPSERIWSRAAAVLTAKRNRLNADVASANIFLRDNEEVIRKHHESLFPGGHDKLFLPSVVENNKEEVDVGQDLFSVKF
jgi:hypothetical protein